MEAGFDLEARILWDAEGLIAVDKPAGWPTAGRDLDDPRCIQHLLMARCRRMVWAVHQLDAGTTGVNLFVRRKALVPVIAERLKRGQKRYLAICHGHPSPSRQRIDAPIGWVEGERRRWVTPEGQAAVSHMEALEHLAGGMALVRVAIETGRTHQVRIHMASIGHPLVGEDRYREPPCGLLGRQALHAHQIELEGGPVIEAELPQDMKALALNKG